MWDAEWPEPKDEVVTGAERCVVVPSPSCPSEFFPQQTTDASSRRAQTWNSPAEICVAVRPAGREIAELGGDRISLPDPPPSPRWPKLSWPQHLIEPSSSSAQVNP